MWFYVAHKIRNIDILPKILPKWAEMAGHLRKYDRIV